MLHALLAGMDTGRTPGVESGGSGLSDLSTWLIVAGVVAGLALVARWSRRR